MTNKDFRLKNYRFTSFGEPVNINERSTLCEICKTETPYHATKRCDPCWNMEQGLRMLADKDKNKAIKWLEDNLKELNGK